MIPRLEIETLGRLKIRLNGNLMNDKLSAKGKGMIVYLAANPHEHYRDKLATYFMNEYQPSSSFRRELCRVKQALPGCLEVTSESVKLHDASTCYLDIQQLEWHIPELCRQPVDELTSEQLIKLNSILTLYKGKFLDGLWIDVASFQMWVTILSINFQSLATIGWDKVVEYHLTTGNYVRGVTTCRHLLEVDNLRSESYCKMMRLLAHLGLHGSISQLYEEAKRHFITGLDSELPTDMVELYQQIRSGFNGPHATKRWSETATNVM